MRWLVLIWFWVWLTAAVMHTCSTITILFISLYSFNERQNVQNPKKLLTSLKKFASGWKKKFAKTIHLIDDMVVSITHYWPFKEGGKLTRISLKRWMFRLKSWESIDHIKLQILEYYGKNDFSLMNLSFHCVKNTILCYKLTSLNQ